MSFSAKISSDHIKIDPGTSTLVNLEISNSTDKTHKFFFDFEGIDPEWLLTPSQEIQIDPSSTQTEKIIIKPSRISESLAGTYPFNLRIVRQDDNQEKIIQGMLEILPFRHISIDISPPRNITTPLKKKTEYAVTIMNLGNSEHTIQLQASDPDESCLFTFEDAQLSLGPGQQKTTHLLVQGTNRAFLATSKLFSFSVFVTDQKSGNIIATAQAQIEQRAAVSPSVFLASVAFLALATGWIAMIPKPPNIEKFTLSRYEMILGDTVDIKWKTSGANNCIITKDQKILFEDLGVSGKKTFQPKSPGQFELAAFATRDKKKSKPKRLFLIVKQPEPEPLPEIMDFSITPQKLNVGQTFSVKYSLNPAATKATLSPPGIPLDPKIKEIELKATRPGEIIYTLVAYNKKGITDEKTVKVQVTDASAASIVVFKSVPAFASQSNYKVRLHWHLSNAVRAEIINGNQVVEVDPNSGAKDLYITKPIALSLIGYDEKGKVVEKHITIDYKDPDKLTEAETSDEQY